MKVGFVSLGCSKNLVDTEMMIGLFKKKSYEIVSNPEEADIIVINTCGFIGSAKEEAINTILEMAEYKKQNCKFLIVTGCLIERYKDELIKEMPEVDLFVKFSEYENFWEQVEKLIENRDLNVQQEKPIDENNAKGTAEEIRQEKPIDENNVKGTVEETKQGKPIDENNARGTVEETKQAKSIDENNARGTVEETRQEKPVGENNAKGTAGETKQKKPIDENNAKETVEEIKQAKPIDENNAKGTAEEIKQVNLIKKSSLREKTNPRETELQTNDNLNFLDRVISTGCNYAYIRIAEGCNNFCTFCAIPYIRGRYTSRNQEDILEEIENLAKQGISEFIIIAQDTTKYGIDIYGKPMLADLLHKISKINGVKWIRFLYSYPETITDELINEVKTNNKICKYFDIPMQHISDKILKSMNRASNKQSIEQLITRLRKEIPGVIIRSTLMVGFPGETEKDFEELYEFVKWAKFDKLGCFTYSKEEGTVASKMDNQIHPSTKKSRYNKIMKLQKEISKSNLEKFIGKEFEVLIEDAIVADDNKLYFVGRTYMDAPEIDGYIYLQGKAEINTFAKCKVTDISEYDLVGEIR